MMEINTGLETDVSYNGRSFRKKAWKGTGIFLK